MEKKSIIRERTYNFALDIINTCDKLKSDKEYDIYRQLLRSGTSIGANVEESQGAQTRKDFLSKLSIAYKESRETLYWLRLLKDSNKLDFRIADKLISECESITKIIAKIRLTTIQKNETNNL